MNMPLLPLPEWLAGLAPYHESAWKYGWFISMFMAGACFLVIMEIGQALPDRSEGRKYFLAVAGMRIMLGLSLLLVLSSLLYGWLGVYLVIPLLTPILLAGAVIAIRYCLIAAAVVLIVMFEIVKFVLHPNGDVS